MREARRSADHERAHPAARRDRLLGARRSAPASASSYVGAYHSMRSGARVGERHLARRRACTGGGGPTRRITAWRSFDPAALPRRTAARPRRSPRPRRRSCGARQSAKQLVGGGEHGLRGDIRGLRRARRSRPRSSATDGRAQHACRAPTARPHRTATHPARAARRSRRCGQSSSSSSPPPARRITIWSSSIVISTGRWPAQCSA